MARPMRQIMRGEYPRLFLVYVVFLRQSVPLAINAAGRHETLNLFHDVGGFVQHGENVRREFVGRAAERAEQPVTVGGRFIDHVNGVGLDYA